MIVCAMHEYHDNSGVLKYLRWNENGLLFYFQSISNAQLTYPYMLMKNRGGVERYRERKRERPCSEVTYFCCRQHQIHTAGGDVINFEAIQMRTNNPKLHILHAAHIYFLANIFNIL